jgi:hypothetical protein
MLLPSDTDGMSECCASTTTMSRARACETNTTCFLRASLRARRGGVAVGPMRRAVGGLFIHSP